MILSVRHMALILCGMAVFPGCCLIDEALRNCGTEYTMDYELNIVTNITTEIHTALDVEADVNVAQALESYLDPVFTPRAHDVDLSFYDVEEPMERLHHEYHIMDAGQTSYTLSIPVRRYEHLAVANLEGNDVVSLRGEEYCRTASLHQQAQDTVPSHSKGIYTARLSMDIHEGEDQEFGVVLRMTNCATVLVLDTLDCAVKDIRVFTAGMATGFDLADSVYRFERGTLVRANQVEVDNPQEVCFATVSFPSRSELVKADEESVLWEIEIYAKLADDSITRSCLEMHEPLVPGALMVLKAKLSDQGIPTPKDATVGVSVQLDWNPGMTFEPSLQ